MKLKHLIVGKNHRLKAGWEIYRSEFDKKTKKFHVLLCDDQKPKEKEGAIGFQLEKE